MCRSEFPSCQLLRTLGIQDCRRIIWSPFGKNVRNSLLLGTSFSNNIYSSRWKWKAPYVKSFLQSFPVREEINSTCHICLWASQVGFYHSLKWFTKLSGYQLKGGCSFGGSLFPLPNLNAHIFLIIILFNFNRISH